MPPGSPLGVVLSTYVPVRADVSARSGYGVGGGMQNIGGVVGGIGSVGAGVGHSMERVDGGIVDLQTVGACVGGGVGRDGSGVGDFHGQPRFRGR